MIALGAPKPPMSRAMTDDAEEEPMPMRERLREKLGMASKEEGDTCPECGMKMGKSEMHGDNLSKEDKMAALEEKIAYLKAELALMKDEAGAENASEDEYADEGDD